MLLSSPPYDSGPIYFIYTIKYADSESEVRFLISRKLVEINKKEVGIVNNYNKIK